MNEKKETYVERFKREHPWRWRQAWIELTIENWWYALRCWLGFPPKIDD